jgi:hypothetical protein
MGRLDDLIRIAGSYAPQRPMLQATEEAANDANGYVAGLLLRHPGALKRIDQFVGDNQLQLGRHLGQGAESVVWEVFPASGGRASVMKVRPEALADSFDFPDDVPGIVPYFSKEQVSPDVAVALQPKADVVFRKGAGFEIPFNHASGRIQQSLLSRGWHWGDGHRWNLGVMPDQTWGVIDGFIDKAHPSWSLPQYTPEESIRMLRMTPDERAAIYGD